MKDVVDGGLNCTNMHCEFDGDQELLFYHFPLEDVVRDLFAEPIAKGKQHLFFKEDVGPDGRRRFTDAHTCLVFEYAARDMEEGVKTQVPFLTENAIQGLVLATEARCSRLTCHFGGSGERSQGR